MPRSSTPRARKPKSANAFTRRLLVWFERHGRDLPWRRTRDPYRVLVSEFMLQQTQVSRVSEYYPRFIARFPDLPSLARAPARAVREEWDGLGYYARARNLHLLARTVAGNGVAEKGVAGRSEAESGSSASPLPATPLPATPLPATPLPASAARLPDDPEELVKLPGVGRYTAGAVASFAYERPVPAVDTNVARVIRRVFYGERLTPQRATRPRLTRQRTIPHHLVWCLAAALVPRNGKRAWKFNQAMMELGALVCTARRPKCCECPVRATCKTGRRQSPVRASS
jgi:A/G-specific adenine glycosylase